MNIQLIRNASLWLKYAGINILVDPMFSELGVNPPIWNTTNDRRNPLVSLPDDLSTWCQPDVILLTHLHQDHWDQAAMDALSKSTPILCQAGDEERIAEHGFTAIVPVDTTQSWQGLQVHRTNGQHGTGEIGHLMGPVSGFVLQADGEPSIYIAGDTIWCEDVSAALDRYHPEITIVNAGGARFAEGDPITMTAEDVAAVHSYAPYTQVVAVHMDAINHCYVTRDVLRQHLSEEGIHNRMFIPEDGEWIEIEQ
ncbi:hypothetical protein BVG16_26065 [Paenibacillus selenitireducens]|uniref:Metallo-beta-lactamase domain-containing protein n=1 Tax=Paenibacillus selenitireducens TaxID=1324314 RepID=A0A1T2X214_9BACL|nr:MBL fold metallo-hydrolase [Paenibacillus selenitireducens]OPA73910.1 hypothetical protein BVG16_26065 [Paenibacillus selenitireducens]